MIFLNIYQFGFQIPSYQKMVLKECENPDDSL